MAGTAASVDQKAGMSSILGISCKCSTGHCKLVLIDSDVIAEADILSMHAKAAEMQRLSKIKAGAPETGHRVVAPSKKSTVDVSFMRTRSKEGERRRVLRSFLRTLDGLSIPSAYGKRRICVETRAQLLCCSVGLVTKMRRELTVEDQTAVAKGVSQVHAGVEELDAACDHVAALPFEIHYIRFTFFAIHSSSTSQRSILYVEGRTQTTNEKRWGA